MEYSKWKTVAWSTLRQNLFNRLDDTYETMAFWTVTRVYAYRVG